MAYSRIFDDSLSELSYKNWLFLFFDNVYAQTFGLKED